jgi:hypothetical protein
MKSAEREQFIETTISAVLKCHAVRREVFFGFSKEHYVVDARIDATKRMKAAGLRHTQIAGAINKSRRTVLAYLSHPGKRIKNRPFVCVSLRQPTMAALKDMAEAKGVSESSLVAGWISERIAAETMKVAA